MNNECKLQIIASDNDTLFWNMLELLKNSNIKLDKLSALEELVDCSSMSSVAAILISTTTLNRDSIDLYKNIKDRLSCPVVVAGSYKDKEDEYLVRKVGISCLIMLPEEQDLIYDFLEKIGAV